MATLHLLGGLFVGKNRGASDGVDTFVTTESKLLVVTALHLEADRMAGWCTTFCFFWGVWKNKAL